MILNFNTYTKKLMLMLIRDTLYNYYFVSFSINTKIISFINEFEFTQLFSPCIVCNLCSALIFFEREKFAVLVLREKVPPVAMLNSLRLPLFNWIPQDPGRVWSLNFNQLLWCLPLFNLSFALNFYSTLPIWTLF